MDLSRHTQQTSVLFHGILLVCLLVLASNPAANARLQEFLPTGGLDNQLGRNLPAQSDVMMTSSLRIASSQFAGQRFVKVAKSTNSLDEAAVAVASNGGHTCAITITGGVECWGNNYIGQLGDGTAITRYSPVSVSGLSSSVTAITLGGDYTCALTTDGAVKCWGSNYYGQLGDGTTSSSTTPVDVSGLASGVIAIAAGDSHTCALTSFGAVKCWGINTDGQLGDGTTIDRHNPVNALGLSTGISAITAGEYHSCAVTTLGTVKCWGNNSSGELGNGTTVSSSTPVDVSGLFSGAIAVSAGGLFTCALSSDGAVQCWGSGGYGELGNGSYANQHTPVNVIGLQTGITAITTGIGNACALTNTGAVKCWGYNGEGQNGDGTNNVYENAPVNVIGIQAKVINIASGSNSDHTCALTSDGAIQCWGNDSSGQLGNGPTDNYFVPSSYVNGLSSNVATIAAGADHTCAVTISGAVKCWGRNDFGEVGDGSNLVRYTPVDVTGLSGGISTVVAGQMHSCALTTTGAVKCWGFSLTLGGGTSSNSYVPVDVVGLSSGIVAIAAGTYSVHTCAITSVGSVKCWGENNAGQLGDGTTTDRYTPVDVIGLSSKVKAISVGWYHTCALTETGAVMCWGANNNGQLGNGTTTENPDPIAVSGLPTNIMSIVAGANHTCALTETGAVMCWGANNSGQLGNGTTTESHTPVGVVGLSSGVVSIAVGATFTCALMTGGQVKCWGSNGLGVLGIIGPSPNMSLTPMDILGFPGSVTAISAGADYGCAIITGGGATCWGDNYFGNLGNGVSYFHFSPVSVIDFGGGSSVSISGNVGIGNGVLNYFDGTSKSVTADENGNYSINVPYKWSGTITPSKFGYTFSPANRPYGNIQFSQTDQNYNAIATRPAPLVIVHGWLGPDYNPSDWDACNKVSFGIEQYNGHNSTMGDLPGWFKVNYDVWIAHIDSSPVSTPSLEKNAICLRNELEHVFSQNPQPITIIAHSMGGLVSRAALNALPANMSQKAVLYTLGSPNAGVPDELLMLLSPSACINQKAVCQFSSSYMENFNSTYLNLGRITYNFIGGDGTSGSPIWETLLGKFSGPNDGIVGKYSAVGWLYPSRSYSPPWWALFSPPGQYWTNEVHVDNWGKSYYSSADDTSPYSHSYECIKTIMNGGIPDTNVTTFCNDAKRTNILARSLSSSTLSLSAFTKLNNGHLDAGQSISIPLTIDTSSTSLFYLSWNGTAPTFTLTRPDNQLIDPAYASANPSEVTYDSFAGGTEVSPYADYSFPTTQPGTWQMNILASSAGAVDYQAFAALDSSRILTAQTNAATYAIGDTATITANLQSSGAGLAGATVAADIMRPDSVVDIISLTDQGGGNYVANYIIPNAPGFLGIDVTATGNDNGTAFSRQEHLIASIKSNALHLTGTYGDQPIDNNGDGLYEKLNFTAGANLTTGGEYEGSADLYSGTQFVTHFADFFNLSTGAQTITLPFDGLAIREAGLNGPYTVKNLSLTPTDTGIPSQSIEIAWVTPSYNVTLFGVNVFSDVPNAYWAQAWIQRLHNAGITGGCSTNPLSYCPDSNVTRAQMAVFLERGMHGVGFSPMPVTLTFGDTFGNFAQYWIEALKTDSITGGCEIGLYCPDTPTTRAQMAVFLLKSEHGSGYAPPPATGMKFTDVPYSYWAASWIEQLANEGITGGCGANLYCPDQPVTRAQMAVFLVKTFNLP